MNAKTLTTGLSPAARTSGVIVAGVVTLVLRAVVLVAALCILAATVALGGMKWSW
jgi:hypothetical protein